MTRAVAMPAPWITATAVWTCAGEGVEPILRGWGQDRRREAPWAWPGARPVLLLPPGVDLPPGAPGRAAELLARVVRAVVPTDGRRTGLVVATSSGAISGDFEASRAAGEDRWGWRQAPTEEVGGALGLDPLLTLSVACASGTAAFAVALGWLAAGRCDRVVVVGLDVLSPYIHAGFQGLGALAAGRCRPFAADRDGLVLGEGAAALLLEHPAVATRPPLTTVRGVGLSQDGVHLTAPDRTGAGLRRAAEAALRQAGVSPGELGVVSAHGTGTVFNDAMEARALQALFGDAPVPLHAAKAEVGHTLGAAGAVEAVLAVAALGGAEVRPPRVDDALGFAASLPSPGGWALSLSAAFGGVNAAVVLGPPGDVPLGPALSAGWPRMLVRDQLPLATLRAGAPAPPTLGRCDNYSRAGIAALAEAGPAPDDLLVLASVSNCHAADLRYVDGLHAGGPATASRAAFVYTLPGAPLAEAAILLGLRGPAVTVCGEGAVPLAEDLAPVLGCPRAWALELEAPAAAAVATLTPLTAPGTP